MAETVFYILGAVVVVLALLISAAGLRSERFPGSGRATLGLAVLVGALVIATGAFAWVQAGEHHDEYAEELAAEREARAGEQAALMREATAPAIDDEAAGDVGGEQVFEAAGCASCHALEAAGSAATVGPDLDETLPGRTPEDIERQIVDPESEITPGFPPGLMPDNYDETLTPEELEALVDFLARSTS